MLNFQDIMDKVSTRTVAKGSSLRSRQIISTIEILVEEINKELRSVTKNLRSKPKQNTFTAESSALWIDRDKLRMERKPK